MKYFWMLVFFCFAAPSESTYPFYRNVPPYQRLLTKQMQRLQRRVPYGFPRPSHIRRFTPNFLFWKHFLELECFKQICGRSQLKKDSELKTPPVLIGYKKKPTARENYENQNFHPTRLNQSLPNSQTLKKYPGQEKVIFWGSEPVHGRQRGHIIPAQQRIRTGATPRFNSSEYQPPRPQIYAKKDMVENPQVFRGKNYSEKTVPDDKMVLKFFQKPGSVPQSGRDNFRPYEVEEVIEENYEVYVNGNKEAGEDRKEYQDDGMTKTESNEDTKHYQNVINNSVNSILRNLITPMNPPDHVVPPRKPEKWSPPPYIRKNFTNHPVPANTFESIFGTPWNYQGHSNINKTLIPALPPNEIYKWRQKSTEEYRLLNKKLSTPDTNTRINNSRRFDFNLPPHNRSYFTNVLKKYNTQSEAYDPPLTPMPTRENVYTVEGTEVPPTAISFRNRTAYFPADSPRKNESVKKESSSVRTEKPTVTSYTFIIPEMTTVLPETTLMGTFNDFELRLNKDIATQPAEFLETSKHYSEVETDGEDVTQRFVEFTDNPISFDLLATTADSHLQEDSDTALKNNRKMQFVHSPWEQAMSNDVLNNVDTEQRRSDILIADNLSDYVDEENNLSSMSYFEKLKLNNSFFPFDPHNLTSDALIPLVSVVINDLRENKISPDDISILSEALGKYWKPILALSNMTNLDILPLLKMKNEKDLENFLQNFFLEEVDTSTTTENSSKQHEDYSELYDYMDQYKDVYKDLFGQEVGKKKRGRPRRDAEDDVKNLEARREYFGSLEEEQNDDENQYIFEDVIYDEMLNDDYSVFELKKKANVELDSGP